MTDDEKLLVQQVSDLLFDDADAGAYAQRAAVRSAVRYAPLLFPPEFVKVLTSDEPRYEKFPNDQLSELRAIFLADAKVPESIKSKNRITQSELEQLDPHFQLSLDENAHVLHLCAALRESIFRSKLFDAPHRRRLLDRVAAIEREIHLPKGRLDVVLGGMSDVGEALGKFGNDIKPIFDRMSEILKITRGGSKEYDQLPPPDEVKRLPPPDEE